MSNLKLPAMDYANLRKLALARPDKFWVPIAYQTWVALVDNKVQVKHHDTVIATVDSTKVVVTHGGYHTRTTANRLNAIVYANCGFWVGIKRGELELRFRNSNSLPLEDGQELFTKQLNASV